MKFFPYGANYWKRHSNFVIYKSMKYILIALLLLFSSLGLSCTDELTPFAEDCELQDRTKRIAEEFQKLGIDYRLIATPRALRFIDRKSWTNYLRTITFDSQTKPWAVYRPAPSTWIYWERGQWRSQRLKSDLENRNLDLVDLQNLHKSSIDTELMTWTSVFLKAAKPGKFRTSFFQRAPEFWIECAWKMSEAGKNLVLNYDLKDPEQTPLIQGTVELCEDGVHYSGHVMYLESEKVMPAITAWVDQFNLWLNSLKAKNIKTSPIQSVADFQRHFVSIHPFGDGNGRMSRYIQDVQLELLGIAAPFSADLQNDLLTPPEVYRKNFKNAINSSLNYLEMCLTQHQSGKIEPGCQVVTTNFSDMQE